ncbi:MAG: hypothetical protein KY476_10030 [Planctomycetes bacterium]|nr:hypothetical protein [Planctomycetota bacterium]
MSRYRFELAAEQDDAALRRVLADTPMDGRIAVSFRRDPSYFDAAVVHGRFSQTVVGRDTDTGRIVGFGVRSVREMFVNGKPLPIGYLSSLRILPPYRNLALVARGYAHFRQLHGDGRTRLYLTTIAEGNERALATLTSGRAGLPPYYPAGRFVTVAIPVAADRGRLAEAVGRARGDWPGTEGRRLVPSGRQHRRRDGICVLPASFDDLPAVLAFWASVGPLRQFFPRYGPADFFCPGATFRDLQPHDVLIARRAGRIVGTLGVWNQNAFRQTVVERYSYPLRCVRPLYNAWAALRRRPPLPPAGAAFRSVTASLPVVADNAADVFETLLEHAIGRASQEASAHLLVGLHEDDPLLPIAARRAAARYVTRLYYVCWEDGEELRRQLDGRRPYLELGTL